MTTPMQVTEIPGEGLRRAFLVVIPAAGIAARCEERLAAIARTVAMPGFRPGRVPAAAVKDRYGAAVLAEVLERELRDSSRRVVTERGLVTAQDPRIEIRHFAEGADLAYRMDFEVMPEVPLPDLAALRLEKLAAEPTPEAVEQALLALATRHGRLVEVAPRPAATGEVLICDVEGRIPPDLLQNGAALGARAGRPGTAPLKWGLDVSPGLVREIVGTGSVGTLPYFDLAVRGTARTGGFIRVFPGAAAGVPARPGQTLTLCLRAEVVAGALPEGATVRLGFNERAGNAILKASRVAVEPGPGEMRATIALTGDPALGLVRPLLEIGLPNGAAVDLVLRVGPACLFEGAEEPAAPPFDGGTMPGLALEVGGGGPVPGLAAAIAGLAPGEGREVDIVYPLDHPVRELAGLRARFSVAATSLRVRERREVDEDLTGAAGVADLPTLRERVRESLRHNYALRSRRMLKRALLDALAAQVDFAVPQGLVAAEAGQVRQRILADRRGGTPEPEEALSARCRTIAERRVRLRLLLTEIGRACGVQVPLEEMARAIRREAGRHPGQEEQVIEFYRKDGAAAEALRAPLLEERIVDFILSRAQVTERAVDVSELLGRA